MTTFCPAARALTALLPVAVKNLAFGDGGADTLNAGPGNDTLDGGEGPDQLAGNKGDDVISGGLGNDAIFGVRAAVNGTDSEIVVDGNVVVILQNTNAAALSADTSWLLNV
jgi:Ca2+-binding RTX toxin-like protein